MKNGGLYKKYLKNMNIKKCKERNSKDMCSPFSYKKNYYFSLSNYAVQFIFSRYQEKKIQLLLLLRFFAYLLNDVLLFF